MAAQIAYINGHREQLPGVTRNWLRLVTKYVTRHSLATQLIFQLLPEWVQDFHPDSESTQTLLTSFDFCLVPYSLEC